MSEQDNTAEVPEVHDPADDYKVEELDPTEVHHDEEDVAAALERETDDGKGGAVVPKADFDSYTEADADVEEKEGDS